jgi:hypothetical protein
MVQRTRLGVTLKEGMKAPVVVATTLNIALQGLPLISGVQLVACDRVLVKSQNDKAENGIYIAAAGTWDRAKDFNAENDITKGQLVVDSNSKIVYQVSFVGDFVINITAITFLKIVLSAEDFDLDIKKLPVVVTAAQTSISVPDAPRSLNLIIDGALQEQSKGAYTYSSGTGTITVSEAFLGGEDVEVQYGLLAPVTSISIDGVIEFTSVSQMILSPDLVVGDKVITYLFNTPVLCNWQVVEALTGAGDMTDGTLTLTGSSLQAKLQKETVMSFEQFGAFGDDVNDDTIRVRAAWNFGTFILGNPTSTYLITDQVGMPNNLNFDGQGCNFSWNGTAGVITYEGRDWGVFSALGVLGTTIDTHVLLSDIDEFEENSYPVGLDSNFTGKDDTYMFVFAGSTSSSPTLPAFSLMPKFIGVTGTNEVAIDYRSGWTIPSGLSITYMNVVPVHDINIRNFTITDKSPTSGDTSDYASAVSIAFAYNCHTSGITGVKFRNPIVFAQYNTDCTSSNGRVERPQATGGGQGYHTQWSYSLRCDTHKLSGYEARHIIDHTKSVYCNVTNCGDTNTADGAYTNHGSYEHDISYTNCHGWHSIGNSGASFGESCKRITIINGNGTNLTAARNVIDLSVYNSRFKRVLANSQGFQADGLTVDDDGTTLSGFSLLSTTTALGRTTLSLRENVIKNSSLVFNSGQALTDANFTGRTLYLENTHLRKINSSLINAGAVNMTGGSITGTTAGIELGVDASIKLVGTDTNSFGVRHLDGVNNSYFIIDGGEHTNIVSTGIYSNRMLTGKAKAEIRNVEIDGASGMIIDMPNASGTNEIFMDFSHSTYSNGSITIKNIYSGAGKMMYTNNLLDTITQDVGATSGRRVNTDNITV